MVRQHAAIDLVSAQFLGRALVHIFTFDIGERRLVGRGDHALPGQIDGLDLLVDAAGGVDAAGAQDRVAVPAHQARAPHHVVHDVSHDHAQPSLGTEHLLNGASPRMSFESSLSRIKHSFHQRLTCEIDNSSRAQANEAIKQHSHRYLRTQSNHRAHNRRANTGTAWPETLLSRAYLAFLGSNKVPTLEVWKALTDQAPS